MKGGAPPQLVWSWGRPQPLMVDTRLCSEGQLQVVLRLMYSY